MKATGIVRNIDHLGRVVIPMELRRTLGIVDKDPVEIFVDGDIVMLKKYAPGCFVCGAAKNLKSIWDKQICDQCVSSIKSLA